jgi:3-dehydroquinate synthase
MLAADLSRRMGLLTQDDVERVAALFRRAGLPVEAPDLGYEAYMSYMGVDKKVEGGCIRFVLLRHLGEAFVTGDYDPAALHATLTEAVG